MSSLPLLSFLYDLESSRSAAAALVDVATDATISTPPCANAPSRPDPRPTSGKRHEPPPHCRHAPGRTGPLLALPCNAGAMGLRGPATHDDAHRQRVARRAALGPQRGHALPLPPTRPAPAHALHRRLRLLSQQGSPQRRPPRPGPAPKRLVAGTTGLRHWQHAADHGACW